MQKVVAVVTLIFFAAVAILLVAGGWSVLFPEPKSTNPSGDATAACDAPVPCEMPTAPEMPTPPTLATDTASAVQQVPMYQHQVTAYQHQVAAYKERVVAYDKYLAAWAAGRTEGPGPLDRYRAVVKDALLPLLNPLVAAFIAYAFVKGTANVVQNIMAARKPEAPLRNLEL